ncbi:TRAP transporter small permease subunit [Mangrovimicrobium sediminis]|uniref:TRAP transporter small permease protein n=1 Tax=Mangrovimicrobium sediminis TaxID=2562682 RepID=A0A4Z0LZE3_9GAMM|nr:TRAP transporter small permease subunit [Haliea sp. SAOS-164]TGD72762.1 TRAP transporter small permease subunit [Haliea sp. SAOS-164]
MGLADRLVQSIDRFTGASGRLLAWLALAMALLTTVIVVARYGFNTGSIPAQESVTYMHACLFLLGAGYALKSGAHVRVDIFYRNFSPRGKAWVNALGGVVFLIPLCLFIVGASWGFVTESWGMRETSTESGGLPFVYLLKTLIPLMALNLLLQGVAETLRALLVLRRGEA